MLVRLAEIVPATFSVKVNVQERVKPSGPISEAAVKPLEGVHVCAGVVTERYPVALAFNRTGGVGVGTGVGVGVGAGGAVGAGVAWCTGARAIGIGAGGAAALGGTAVGVGVGAGALGVGAALVVRTDIAAVA